MLEMGSHKKWIGTEILKLTETDSKVAVNISMHVASASTFCSKEKGNEKY